MADDPGKILEQKIAVYLATIALALKNFAEAITEALGNAETAITEYRESTQVPPAPDNVLGKNGMFIHGAWSNTGRWSKSQLQIFKDSGVDHFRVGVFWQYGEPQKGQWNETYLSTIKALVADIKALDMTCYFDIIHMYKSGGVEQGIPAWAKTEVNATACVTKHAWAWIQKIATMFKDEVAVQGIDINEPDDWQSANNVLRMHDFAIRALRQISPRLIYFLEPSYGNGDPTNGDPAIVSNWSNVVVSIHCYFVGWVSGKAVYAYDGTTGWTNRDATQISQWIGTRLAWAKRAGVPLHIGEFGIGLEATGRDAWIQAMNKIQNDLGIALTWWEGRTGSGDRLSAMNQSYQVYPHIKNYWLQAA